MNKLTKIRYQGRLWYFDSRLMELRDCEQPTCNIGLHDYEVDYVSKKVANSKKVVDLTNDL